MSELYRRDGSGGYEYVGNSDDHKARVAELERAVERLTLLHESCHDTWRIVTEQRDSLKAELGALQWISVEERLPEEDALILFVISNVGGTPYVKIGLRSWDGNDWWWCNEDGEYDEQGNDADSSIVTHWMPLPNPPKGEGL